MTGSGASPSSQPAGAPAARVPKAPGPAATECGEPYAELLVAWAARLPGGEASQTGRPAAAHRPAPP